MWTTIIFPFPAPLAARRVWIRRCVAVFLAAVAVGSVGPRALGGPGEAVPAGPVAALAADDRYGWDVSAGRGWLPALPDALTEAERAAMQVLSGHYGMYTARPEGAGADPAAVEAASREVRERFGVVRDPETGVVRGRPIVLTGEGGAPAEDGAPLNFAGDIEPAFKRLHELYRQCAAGGEQAAQLEALYRDLAEHLVNQRWDPAANPEKVWLGIGYAWRRRQPVRQVLAMRTLLDAAVHDRLCETMCWVSEGHRFYDERPELSTDLMLNALGQAIGAVCAMHESPAKWQRLLCIRRAIDLGVLHSSRQGLVTPDGGVIHHAGMHVSYAGYSFGSVVQPHLRFAQAGVLGEHSVAAAERLVAAGVAWAWFTQPGKVVPNVEMRVALPAAGNADEVGRSRGGGGGDPAWRAEQLVMALRDQGVELTIDDPLPALLLAKQPGIVPEELRARWAEQGIGPGGLTGHLALPVSGAALHRREGFLVALRGQNRFFRGGEGAAYAPWGNRISYAQRFCQGSLMILNQGEPANAFDSGYRLEGFNYALVPGTTGPLLPLRHMVGRYFGTDAALGGGVALDGQGLWAFGPSNCRKSAWFIDHRVTLVTTHITLHPEHPVTTTLCQAAHDDLPNQPTIIDGRAARSRMDWTLEQPAGHWFLDHLGRGYYIHESDGPLRLFRREQAWTYTEPPFVTELAEGETYQQVTQVRPIEAMLERFTPTTADYTTAYLEHDRASDNPRCAFTVLVGAQPEDMRAFARAVRRDAPPVAYHADNTVHYYHDHATGLRGHVFFEATAPGDGSVLDRIDPEHNDLLGAGRPCYAMSRRDGPVLRIAVASTDLDDPAPLTLTLRGHWAAPSGLPESATLTHDNARGLTTLAIPYRDQTQINVTLHRP